MKNSIRDTIGKHNREKAIEALIDIGVGAASLLVIYFFVFWIGWVGAWLTWSSHGVRPLYLALGVTGLFLLVALLSAWRRIDPISHVDLHLSPEEMANRNVQNAIGLHAGIPVIRRDTLAWSGTILIGPFAGILEGLAAWRERVPTDAAFANEANQLLRALADNQRIEERSAARILGALSRMGLIKPDASAAEGFKWTVTRRGREALA